MSRLRLILVGFAAILALAPRCVSAQGFQSWANDQKSRSTSSSVGSVNEAMRRAAGGDARALLELYPPIRKSELLSDREQMLRAMALVVAGRRAEAAKDCQEFEEAFKERRTSLLEPTTCIALSCVYADLGNEPARLSLLRRVTQHHPKDEECLRRLAWALATSSNAQVRNGREALGFGEAACQRTRWKNPDALNAFAAALAEVGRWEEASRWQNEATTIARSKGKADLAEMEKRLALYQSRKPFREQFGPAGQSRRWLAD